MHSRLSLVILATAFGTCAAAQPAPSPAPLLGVAWYPEQWPEARWAADLDLMRQAGVGFVRVGEFAWSSLEPQEGSYELGWLERAVDAAAARHIGVVIATPTDAPPAWLTTRYPDTLRVDAQGQRMAHGARRQFSYASPRYRASCRTIAGQLAGRFGRHPNIIGWQIGNEYTEESYDEAAQRAFRDWLRARYGALDELNRRWMTRYWSETYDTWEEISLPGERANPGLSLDHMRFVTDEWRSFQRNQLDAIRARAEPRQFITTNLGGLGWADRFNRADVSADLDLASWDEYVGEGHLDPYRFGATHDLVRGWKHRNFWVMEAQPGFVDWAPVSNCLDRGETRMMAWEAVGHGADGFAFWQWRAGLNGQEQYHGVLVGPDGQPVPFYEEARQIGAEFAKAGAALRGTAPVSEVAILHDYDSRWAIDLHPQSRRYDQIEVLLGYYRPLRDLAQSVDIVDPRSPLGGYRLVAAPSLNVISEELARHLLDYVRQGGHLVLGPRSGMKDEFNSLDVRRQPGPLVPALGGSVRQFHALLDDVPVTGLWGGGKATIWAEQLATEAPGVETLMTYGESNGWLDRQPAVITRRVGRGSLTYIGAVLDAPLMRAAAQWMLERAQVPRTPLAAPEGVEICRRVGQDREVFVLINHTRQAVLVDLPRPMRDVLGGRETRMARLATRGVAVLSCETASSPQPGN